MFWFSTFLGRTFGLWAQWIDCNCRIIISIEVCKCRFQHSRTIIFEYSFGTSSHSGGVVPVRIERLLLKVLVGFRGLFWCESNCQPPTAQQAANVWNKLKYCGLLFFILFVDAVGAAIQSGIGQHCCKIGKKLSYNRVFRSSPLLNTIRRHFIRKICESS